MQPGQTFHSKRLDGSGEGTATVLCIRSDREEGLAPEADQYAARWLEARPTATSGQEAKLTFMLGTDRCVYLDGGRVEMTYLSVL